MLADALAWLRLRLPPSVRPYAETAPLAALFLGISSGAPYAMIAATLTTRLAQDGLSKSTVTAFTLVFLMYNIKWAWAWIIDSLRLPLIGRLGQRVSWLLLTGALVMAAIANLGLADPRESLFATAIAAILVAVAGASFDVVIDAYRIESLEPRQLGTGSGMSQYGWRVGAALAGAVALIVAEFAGWTLAYVVCGVFALPAMFVGLILGEPARHRAPIERRGVEAVAMAVIDPLREFLTRTGAWLILVFVLLHKVGDTLANLTLRLLFDDLGFSNVEISFYDVGIGFVALLAGIFVGGILYARVGLKQSVLISLWLMALTNLGFAVLAAIGPSPVAMGTVVGFENFASGIGGVVVVAYLSALCDLRYTATHFALLSAAASVLGRFLSGTTAGYLIDLMGYVNFYLLTTVAALPGILVFWLMMRSGLVDRSIGSAAKVSTETGRSPSG